MTTDIYIIQKVSLSRAALLGRLEQESLGLIVVNANHQAFSSEGYSEKVLF